MLSALVALMANNNMVMAQADGTSYTVDITGKTEGPYNLRATVKAPSQPSALTDTQAKKSKPKNPNDDALGGFFEMEKILSGRKTWREEQDERFQAEVKAQEESAKQMKKMMEQYQNSLKNQPATTLSSEGHHNPGSGEDHHAMPTDGSPNSESITGNAINTFYEGLPPQVTDHLSGNSGIDLSGSDPYADYARALQASDFNRMRALANSDAITDFNQRIAMLGLAGAAALNTMAKPQNSNNFAAKDTLRKVAEDLQYAGQGLDPTKPKDAKLKAICEDISRIWNNMTNPPK